jgi:hypothetical protein
MSDSAFSSGENTFQLVASGYKHKWSCMKDFKDLVFIKDHVVSVQVMQHVLKLICQGNDALKMQIFQHIYIPILSYLPNSKNENDEQLPDGLPEKVVNYCLNSLPLLLQVKKIFHYFINIGGIRKLCHFLKLSCFRSAACKVFQMLVILEEKFEEAYENIGDINSTTNHWVTQHLETEAREPFEVEIDNSNNMTDITDKERNICIETMISLLNNGIPEETDVNRMLGKKYDWYIDEVNCDIWQAANVLITHSVQFKRQFLYSHTPQTAFALLNECFKYVRTCECNGDEVSVFDPRSRSSQFTCKMALLQALLNVCLICLKHGLQLSDKVSLQNNYFFH